MKKMIRSKREELMLMIGIKARLFLKWWKEKMEEILRT
jgi:hypothetical protein